jgi:hypothetical protein
MTYVEDMSHLFDLVIRRIKEGGNDLDARMSKRYRDGIEKMTEQYSGRPARTSSMTG